MLPETRTTPVSHLIERGLLAINDGYRAKNSELGDKGLPFARGANIKDGFHFKGTDRFPIENLARVGLKKSEPGDVVFTSKGTVGRFAFVTEDVPGFVYSPQLCFWRSLDHDVISPEWLYYWMHGKEFFGQYSGVKGQTDMAEYVSLRDQRRMHITLPPINEQRRAAETLGSFDQKITLNRAINLALEDTAKALFQSWFVDFDPVKAKLAARQHGRDPELAAMSAISGTLSIPPGKPKPEILDDQLPTSETLDTAIAALDELSDEQRDSLAHTASLFPNDLKDGELGLIPSGWEPVAIKDVTETTDYVANGSFASLKCNVELFDEENDVLYVRTRDFNNGFSGNLKYTTKGAYEFLEKSKLYGRETIISNVGDVGTVFRPPRWLGKPMTLGSNAVVLKNGAVDSYFFWYFRSQHGQAQLQSIVTGSAQLKFNKTNLRALRILWPSRKILRRFEQMEVSLDQKIVSNRSENELLVNIKNALLPKLLSGEIRIPMSRGEAVSA